MCVEIGKGEWLALVKTIDLMTTKDIWIVTGTVFKFPVPATGLLRLITELIVTGTVFKVPVPATGLRWLILNEWLLEPNYGYSSRFQQSVYVDWTVDYW